MSSPSRVSDNRMRPCYLDRCVRDRRVNPRPWPAGRRRRDLPARRRAAPRGGRGSRRHPRTRPYADLVGTFVLRDTDLPLAARLPARAVGRGHRRRRAARRPPAGLAARARTLAIAGTRDRAARPRRPRRRRTASSAAIAARADDDLDDRRARSTSSSRRRPGDTPLAGRGRRGGGSRAAAEVPHRRRWRRDAFPSAAALAGWIDAALDRETPFKCTAGLHHAVRHTERRRLRAPRLPQRPGRDPAARSTAPRVDDVVACCEQRDAGRRVVDRARQPSARRRAPLVHVVRVLLGRRAASTDLLTLGPWELR